MQTITEEPTGEESAANYLLRLMQGRQSAQTRLVELEPTVLSGGTSAQDEAARLEATLAAIERRIVRTEAEVAREAENPGTPAPNYALMGFNTPNVKGEPVTFGDN